jgi:transposase-like protein
MPSRQLSTADLAAARQAYEAGASYRELRSRYGTSNSTIRVMLAAVGVTPPQPAVEITPDVTGRLRIPWRTREERRMRRWTPAERQAIAVELAAGRVQRVRRGRSGLPERPSIAQRRDAEISFWRVLQRVKAAA